MGPDGSNFLSGSGLLGKTLVLVVLSVGSEE